MVSDLSYFRHPHLFSVDTLYHFIDTIFYINFLLQCIHKDLAARNIRLGKNCVAKVTNIGSSCDIYDRTFYEHVSSVSLDARLILLAYHGYFTDACDDNDDDNVNEDDDDDDDDDQVDGDDDDRGDNDDDDNDDDDDDAMTVL